MTIKIYAYHNGEFGGGLVGVQFCGTLSAEQLAKLPKYVGWKQRGDRVYTLQINLKPTGTTGTTNEAGIKRIRKLLDVLDGDFEYKANASNSHATLAEFVELHGI